MVDEHGVPHEESSELVVEPKRGLFTESGIPILITPSQSQLDRIANNPQIEYFSALGDSEQKLPLSEDELERMKKGYFGLGGAVFGQYVIAPLSEHLRTKYGNEVFLDERPLVGVRGIACSLDDDIDLKGIRVRGIENIVRDGSEQEEVGETNLLYRDLGDQKPIRGYPIQYVLTYSQKFRRLLEGSGMEKSIFPVILLFDLTKLGDGEGYAERLPKSAEERAKVIMKAIVLDYPVK